MATALATSTYLDLFRTDSDLLLASARGSLDRDVPPCPGWTVRDVVTHTAEVYEHKLRCIAEGMAPKPWPPQWPDRDRLEWYADARDRLLDVLSSTDPAAPAFTWWPPDQTVGFWVRRMAQETAVHRVDVQSASDAISPVDPALAADGVDEVLMIMASGDWSDEPQPELTERVDVRTGGHRWSIDLAETWLTVLADPGSDHERSSDADHDTSSRPAVDPPATAAATVTGEPGDVLLWLWGRAPDDAIVVDGDRAAAARLRTRLALATG